MNIRKEKLDLFKSVYTALKHHLKDVLNEEQMIILHLYLMENKGLNEIADQLHFTDYRLVKEEIKAIELKVSALA